MAYPTHDKDLYDLTTNSREYNTLKSIMEELTRARAIWPRWPSDIFEALAIVNEELGESQQAALQLCHENGSIEALRTELIQLAAMVIRMIVDTPMTPSDIEKFKAMHKPLLPQINRL